MPTVVSRIVRFGFQNFWRYGFSSLATVAVLVISLSLFLTLILFRVTANQTISSIEDKIDISVYFKSAAPDGDMATITESVRTLPEVASVEFISKDQALEIFRERHQADPTITQAINELTTNPLLAHLNIKATDPSEYATIAEYINSNENISQYVESVSYFDNKLVIERLNSITSSVNRGVLVLTIVLTIVGALVVFNTIWLAIFANREEIMIMRLVGASNALVRGPYVVHGIIAGVVSAAVSFIVAIPVVHVIHPYLSSLIPTFSLTGYFYRNAIFLLAYQMLFGVALGAVASFLAIRKYLRY
jgi:cell division transport system permease protein